MAYDLHDSPIQLQEIPSRNQSFRLILAEAAHRLEVFSHEHLLESLEMNAEHEVLRAIEDHLELLENLGRPQLQSARFMDTLKEILSA